LPDKSLVNGAKRDDDDQHWKYVWPEFYIPKLISILFSFNFSTIHTKMMYSFEVDRL